MENYVMVITQNDINYAGELYNGFVENGVLIKPSKKSCMHVWIPVQEIKCILFPNNEELCGKDINLLFDKLNEINYIYSTND